MRMRMFIHDNHTYTYAVSEDFEVTLSEAHYIRHVEQEIVNQILYGDTQTNSTNIREGSPSENEHREWYE